ncbi:uncharacterized protein NECHADRAFT_82649 [Fusarium vanettenii 77-13-4]|uniref:Peptidase A1 domain-containing protein n=1 Tax=Fusarium vanettenii (strain ATCC MYA-4622 / CBS 123669 / FGSC 9596 / NRRL 45880 / 77-13-4) TaxID=660122 RepID=C7YXU2_FUSV7|nr:uncharacterized protein NECHADRAFT_82649 [Fusarium vanettenii 77-13-4]EEU43400.1 predicted protein [Fusarium vanettenii 77-13-4]
MRLSLVLPFLGSVWAAPTEPSSESFPSIFDNPTIPTVNPAELGIPDDSPLFRRAAATTQGKIFLNLSRCELKVARDGGWSFKAESRNAVLWIAQGLPSPGTKNGQNPYDLYVDAGIPTASVGSSGSVQFLTNAYMKSLPSPGTSVDDYAKVTIPSGNTIKADINFSNVPIEKQPNRFNALLVDSKGAVGPVTLFYPDSGFVSALVADKGDVTGWVWLNGYSDPTATSMTHRGFYYAKITGFCIKSGGPWTFVPPA